MALRKKPAPKNGSVGRPTKFTRRLAKQICKRLENGLSIEEAVWASDITSETFRRWRRQGLQDKKAGIESDLCWFYGTIKKAYFRGIARRADRIDKAGQKGCWQADAWYLERVVGKQFLKKESVATVNVPIEMLTGGKTQLPTKEELITQAEETLRLLKGQGRIEAGGSNGSHTKGDG